jgi:hypothetical protein
MDVIIVTGALIEPCKAPNIIVIGLPNPRI